MSVETAPQPVQSSERAVVCAVEEGLSARRAFVAMGVGCVLIVLTAFAVRATEMVTGRYVSHGVPPLPAFAATLLLSLARPILRERAPRLAPTQAQILLIYIMLTI